MRPIMNMNTTRHTTHHSTRHTTHHKATFTTLRVKASGSCRNMQQRIEIGLIGVCKCGGQKWCFERTSVCRRPSLDFAGESRDTNRTHPAPVSESRSMKRLLPAALLLAAAGFLLTRP